MKKSSSDVALQSGGTLNKAPALSLCPPTNPIAVQVRVDDVWRAVAPNALQTGDIFRFCREDGSALNEDRIYEARSPWEETVPGVDGARVGSGIRARLLPAA